jgi:hypothetical protein
MQPVPLHSGAQYPSEPPAAHYHSYGLRVNPNLYENGKVCLSLLATWAGKGSEVWNPDTSNMLQAGAYNRQLYKASAKLFISCYDILRETV